MDKPNPGTYLQIFCSYQQDNWYTLLPLAEFAYNNTTRISLFFANKDYHPNLTIHPKRDLASSRAKVVVDLDELHQELKTAIAEAQLRYQGPADAKRAPPLNFIVGQQAFVIKAKFFRSTRPSHKLSEKFLGPFEILAKAGSHSYTLQLPKTIHGVHPIFHVSMLEPATPNKILNCVQSLPPPVDIQGDLEYEIAEVADSKIDQH